MHETRSGGRYKDVRGAGKSRRHVRSHSLIFESTSMEGSFYFHEASTKLHGSRITFMEATSMEVELLPWQLVEASTNFHGSKLPPWKLPWTLVKVCTGRSR